MNIQTVRREGRAMRQVSTDLLTLTLDEATGRLLEMADNRSNRHVLMWRPIFLATGNLRELGGFGPFGPLFDGATFRFRKAGKSFSVAATLANGCTWRQRFTVDAATLRVDLHLANPTEEMVIAELPVALSCQPGYGGDWPRMRTACLNNQQKVALADRRGRIEEAYPITGEDRTRGFGDAAWLAVTDRSSGQGIWAQLPAGRLELFTAKSFDFSWRDRVTLAPGASERWTFRLAAFSGLENPEAFADGHLAGSSGNRLAAAGGAECFGRVIVRLFGNKPEPVSLQPPRWSPTRVASAEYGEVLARLRSLRDAAGADCRRAAVLGSFLHRARHLENRAPAAQITELRALVAEAEQTAAAVQVYRSYYSESDLANMRRLAEGFDTAAEAAGLKDKLAEPFRIEHPRLRHYEAARSPHRQQHLMGAAAALAAVTGDRELARLAARRLVDGFADAWLRFGTLMNETIQNGVLISHLAPAYSLLADLGAFDDDPDGEAAVVAMLADLAGQIHTLRRDWHSVSNWQGMEQAGITAVFAVLPGHPQTAGRVEYAVGQFEYLLTKGVLADGMFWEQSASYHQNVQQFIMMMAENLLRCGVDLFAIKLADRSILELARHTADLLMPNGKAPRFEDSSHNVNAALMAHYARRFRDPHLMAAARFAGYTPGAQDLRWPAEPLADAEPLVLPRCRILPASGRAILRSGETALALDFGPHGGWHGDWDKMTFELFDADGALVCDPGTFRYEEALHWNHFKHTTSHSTVTLDDARQLACCGHLVAHDCIDDRHTVTAEAVPYPGVTHRRTVAHADAGYRIEDRLTGEIAADEAVFRLTFPKLVTVNGASAETDRLRINLLELTGADRVEVVEIPIMPLETKTAHDEPCTTGWQLRWHRPLQAGQREVRFACTLLPSAIGP